MGKTNRKNNEYKTNNRAIRDKQRQKMKREKRINLNDIDLSSEYVNEDSWAESFDYPDFLE